MQTTDQENMSFSEENILANSIRIARQRFGKLDEPSTALHRNNHNQTCSLPNRKESSAAQAIKVLHARISELEAFNFALTKQVSQAKRQNNLKNLQLESLRSESADFQAQIADLKDNLRQSERSYLKRVDEIQQSKQKMEEQQKYLRSVLAQREQKLEASLRVRQSQEEKLKELNKRIENNQRLIVQMIREVEEEKEKNNSRNILSSPNVGTTGYSNKHSKSNKSKQHDTFPVIIDEPEEEQTFQKNSFSQKQKRMSQSRGVRKKVDPVGLPDRQLQEKNKQLYQMLRNSNRKFQEEEKLKNQYRQRFYTLKTTVDLLIEEVNKLPTAFLHKFKCLIVKVRKMDQQNLECIRGYSRPGNRLYSNSSRHSSKQSSAASKKKEKQLKMEDLSLSDHNMSQTRSHSKSKRESSSNHCLKSNSGEKKSGPSAEHNEERVLSRRIREQRKQMCDIYRRVQEEADPEKKQVLKKQFQQRMAQNVELQAELQNCRKPKVT